MAFEGWLEPSELAAQSDPDPESDLEAVEPRDRAEGDPTTRRTPEPLYPRIVHLLGVGRRHCGCVDASWEIGPESGWCRVCRLRVAPHDVRRMQALANWRIAWHGNRARA